MDNFSAQRFRRGISGCDSLAARSAVCNAVWVSVVTAIRTVLVRVGMGIDDDGVRRRHEIFARVVVAAGVCLLKVRMGYRVKKRPFQLQ